MNIDFNNLPTKREELIKIILHLKKYCEDITLEKKIAIDSFKAYRTSINQSLDKIKKDLNKQAEEFLIKATGKKR